MDDPQMKWRMEKILAYNKAHENDKDYFIKKINQTALALTRLRSKGIIRWFWLFYYLLKDFKL